MLSLAMLLRVAELHGPGTVHKIKPCGEAFHDYAARHETGAKEK
jgi:hypothetical protein